MYVHLWSLFLIVHIVSEKLSRLLQYNSFEVLSSLIEMITIKPMMTMRTIMTMII